MKLHYMLLVDAYFSYMYSYTFHICMIYIWSIGDWSSQESICLQEGRRIGLGKDMKFTQFQVVGKVWYITLCTFHVQYFIIFKKGLINRYCLF